MAQNYKFNTSNYGRNNNNVMFFGNNNSNRTDAAYSINRGLGTQNRGVNTQNSGLVRTNNAHDDVCQRQCSSALQANCATAKDPKYCNQLQKECKKQCNNS